MQTLSFIAFPSTIAFASESSATELALATPFPTAIAAVRLSAPQSTLAVALSDQEELPPFVPAQVVLLLVAAVATVLPRLAVIQAALLATATLVLRFPFQNKLTIPINSNN